MLPLCFAGMMEEVDKIQGGRIQLRPTNASVSVLLSSDSVFLGRVVLVHHEETCPETGTRKRWHVRERRLLGRTVRSLRPCDCFIAETGSIHPSLRVLRWIP
jgi:hypothetical protein